MTLVAPGPAHENKSQRLDGVSERQKTAFFGKTIEIILK